MIARLFKSAFFVFSLICITGEKAYSQGDTILPQGATVFGNFYSILQANSPLILPDGSRTKIHPFYQYLELTAASPRERISFNGFFREREILSGEERTFDLYNAYLQFDGKSGSLNVRLGRQTLTEGTNYYLLDGGLLRIRPADQLELVAYGGYQDQNTQPDPEDLFKSAALFGIKLKFHKFLDSIVSVGYERIDPNDFSSKDFLHLSLNRVVPFTRSADLYSRGEIDLGEGNLALLTAGVGIVPFRSLYLNLEYDAYQPDKDRGDFLQDRIFDLFSVSQLHEARGGLTYIVNSFLKTSASYSFSRYEVLDGEVAYGQIAKLGLSWDFWHQIGLKAFQGLYFLNGRGEDRAVGANLGISQELLRGLDLQYSFAYVQVETITHQEGDAFSHALGIQYLIVRNLLVKAEVEMNANPDLKTDTRANLAVSYYFYF